MMFRSIAVAIISAGVCVSIAHGGIDATGDVLPADPSTWMDSTQGFVGYTGDGELTIDDGSDVISQYGFLAYESGSSGVATVSGAGSTWTSTVYFCVGNLGDGELEITDRGTVDTQGGCIGAGSGSIAVATVTGLGSTLSSSTSIIVASSGTDATLNITAGGEVTSADGVIGYASGSSGDATVSGASSTWTNSSGSYVGYGGGGDLQITAGGTVNDTRGYIGFEPGAIGSVAVSGGGSSWVNGGGLSVGAKGSGTLDIIDGATVSSADSSVIGAGPDSVGVVTLSSGGEWTNTGSLVIGHDGDGSLNIGDGCTVEVSDETYLAVNPGSNGSIDFDGGTLTTGGFWGAADNLSGVGEINTTGFVSDVDLVFDATHGLTQTLTLGGPGRDITVNLDVDGSGPMGAAYAGTGSLHISDGVVVQSTVGGLGDQPGSVGAATVSGAGSAWANSVELHVGYHGSGRLDISDGGAVSGEGYIGSQSGSTGAVTVSGDGSAWTDAGDLYVGSEGSGALTIADGGLVSVGGVLTIDFNGGDDSFVDMGSGGMLALAGEADSSLGEFLGLVEGSDAIRYWDPVAWDWADITGAAPGDYTLIAGAGDLTGFTILTVTAALPHMLGDTNGDYIVDDADYANLVVQFGGAPGAESADFDGDGLVDLEDFSILRGNFGYGVAAAPGFDLAATTPEPATIAMLAAGLPGLLRLRRRRPMV